MISMFWLANLLILIHFHKLPYKYKGNEHTVKGKQSKKQWILKNVLQKHWQKNNKNKWYLKKQSKKKQKKQKKTMICVF